MDSFYDAPRPPFKPTNFLDDFPRAPPRLEVPDLSLLSPNKRTTYKENQPTNYQKPANVSLLKKVRFENPNTMPAKPDFGQIYLANVPKKQLELSYMDLKSPQRAAQSYKDFKLGQKLEKGSFLPAKAVQEQNEPKSYREFRELKENCEKNDVVTDIYNYRSPRSVKTMLPIESNTRSSNPINHYHHHPPSFPRQPESNKIDDYLDNQQNFTPIFKKTPSPTKYCTANTQTSFLSTPSKRHTNSNTQTSFINSPLNRDKQETSTADPTVKDLLKIITQQNEQLILLQKQVASLIEDKAQQKREIIPITSTQHDFLPKNSPKKPPRGALPKFSIDLMTSFEVSFRRPPPGKSNNKIQEITEEARSTNDCSMNFQTNEPLQVMENCPSPEPEVQIDMNDFESSDEESLQEQDIGATFYENLLGHVNKILQKAHINDERNNEKVRQATLKHLKSIGVVVPSDEQNSSCNSSNPSNLSEEEVSFAVKQLLMKYLPQKHLGKLSNPKPHKKTKPGTGLIPSRPEFSFASVQYMKKYNLLANNDQQNLQGLGPKILDMSKLKNQPKLL